MAIDFPNAPVDGTTYDFLGVRYTFTKPDSNEGYWRVAVPGTVGIATPTEISEGIDTLKYITPNALAQTEEWKNITDPAGMIGMFPVLALPAGYLECIGTAVSRTTYARLFAVLGTAYGVGDGSTTFNLPDLRGEFVRGYDGGAGNDPDAATRTDRGDGTSGDVVGSKQVDELKSHDHIYQHNNYANDNSGVGSLGIDGQFVNYTSQATGGAESRPRNVQLKYCIKF